MSRITFILSDLHLADGHTILDSFGDAQQAAFEGLLAAACTAGPLGLADDVELVINGDCFDFLSTSPFTPEGISDVPTALAKLRKIIDAHGLFFATLHRFITTPGRHITFVTGNHDIELCFEEIRVQINAAIGIPFDDQRVFFCPTRFYRPMPDVYVEHGNYYDFWNHAMAGLWDEQGNALNLKPETITLPVGSHYFQHAAHLISLQYAYFDHLEPSMNSTRQIALLCLLDPQIVMETASLTTQLISEPHPALMDLAPGDECVPVKLFEQAMITFFHFRQDMIARKKDWVESGGSEASERTQAQTMMEHLMLREALTLHEVEAVAAICTPATYTMGEDVARGMHTVLTHDPSLRYAIAGHTHMVRINPVSSGTQSYLNTGSWTARMALPAPGEVNKELVEWLKEPDYTHIPLRDVTQFSFALVNSTPGGSSSASLCVWEGGSKGSYRVLA
jgi:UDP-2,3-diacylglucosamine pyrophosphatase LpxH